MKTTVVLFLVLCLLAVQANPSGEGGTGAGADTGADSGNDGGTGARAGSGNNGGTGAGASSGSDKGFGAGASSGSDKGSGAGAVSGGDGGAGTGDESGSNGGAGAGAGSGSDGGSGDGYFQRYYVRDRNHLRQLLSGAGDTLVMLYFLSNHCGSCQYYIPQPYKLNEEFGNYLIILTVDIDVTKDIPTDYNIQEIPAFIFVKKFKKVAESYGLHYEALRTIVLRYK